MRQLLLSILFLSLLVPGSAQEWAEVGTSWHYSQYSFGWPVWLKYHKFTSVDTITIDGKLCKKILYEFSDPGFEVTHYHYQDGQQVYWYDTLDLSFKLLYDFSLEPGDTLVSYPFHSQIINNTDTAVFSIDSVSTTLLNGQERKVQFISELSQDWLYEFGAIIIEGVGSMVFLTPTPSLTDSGPGPIRCFESPGLGLIQFQENIPECDFVNTEYLASDVQIEVSPNPFQDELSIKLPASPSKMDIRLADLQGRTWMDLEVKNQDQIKLSVDHLPAGIYFLQVGNAEWVHSRKVLKN